MSADPSSIAFDQNTMLEPSSRFLGLGMIALGLIRGWSGGVAVLQYLPSHVRRIVYSPATVPWDEFAGVAWGTWPVVLGIALITGRSTRLFKSATITCVAMVLERGLTLMIGGLFDSGWSQLYRGPWNSSLGPVLPRGSGLWLLLGSLIAWIGFGAFAFRTWRRTSDFEIRETPSGRASSRRQRPRFVNLAAGTFAVAVLLGTAWVAYITTLERLPWVRALVLSGDRRRSRPIFVPDTPDAKRFREADRYFSQGQGEQAKGQFLEARRLYAKALNRYEALTEEFPKTRRYRRQFALAANNLAWFLVTCPDESVREPEVAVIIAKKAVAIDANDGNALNTLAVAQYRAGEIDEAWETFAKSMDLRDGGDSFDWFFLAQIEALRNHPAQAFALYEKAVAWST